MKQTTLILILLLTVVTVKSQSVFRWGLVGGINASKVVSDTKTKSLNGYHGGLIAEIKTPTDWGFEVDALMSSKGTRIEGLNSNLETALLDYKLNYLDFPVLVKKYFLSVINVQAGPQFSYLLSANYDGNDVKSNLHSFDLAAVVGLGIDVKVAKASIRYNYGLTEIGKGDGHNSVLQITLGIWVN
ncbi:MAG: PorT family protein [Flavobacteriales bacterium]|nr:PorT family protein [Flavobacteriales bacterium]MCB9173404.1 PorT family protein [Flavobacteriales bacterium]